MRKKIMRFLSVLLVVSVFLSGMTMQVTTVFADTPQESSAVETDGAQLVDTDTIESSDMELQDYYAYIKDSGITQQATDNIEIPLANFTADGTQVTVDENGLKWTDGMGSVTWNFDVATDGLYNIQIDWSALESGINPNPGIMIDGQYPFENSDDIEISRLWTNATEEPRTDAQGNQYAQEQKEITGTVSSILRDDEGVVVDPYEFALTAGAHTLTIVKPSQGILIEKITFIAPEKIKPYSQVSASYDVNDTDADIITLEGEKADIKSSNSIIPKSNNSDAGMSPSDAYTTLLNYIGGTSWQTPGTSIAWNFDVETSGYYYINLRYKQTDLVNGESWRWLKIDGKTPFEEAKCLRFPYGTAWEYYTLGDEEEPFFIWLDKGHHTISLEVTIGDQTEYFQRLSDIVETLGDEYIKIIMITGDSPDVNRDYELFKQIPGFNDTLKKSYDDLMALADDMTKDTTGNVSQAVAAIKNMARVLNNMLRSPYYAQQYINDYYTCYTSISSWLYDMTKMPLAIDQLQIVPAGKDYVDNTANFFEDLAYGTVRLISSFTNDYSLTNSDDSKEGQQSVRLWVNGGQDQAAALNSLIQDSFTAKTGINVQLEIVNASIINGILAGNFPDVSLSMARTDPVNLGIRGALTDLSQFSDFEEVLGNFQEGAEIPYTYNGATYALPDSQNFFLMFYRTDILEQLELEVPNTWDEFLHCATIIQRNNMGVYVPYTRITDSTTVNAGIGNLSLFPTLMSQNNLSLYNEERNATALDTKEALDVFEYWTDFYYNHDIEKEADFYNRLRLGIMPLGIAPYPIYMTIYSTAPEIQGRWSIALVPGTRNEDGTINRTVAGAGSGCAIIKKSPNQEAAWEFLKWWVSAETQTRYNNNIESILGVISRSAVSNVEAFNSLAWDPDDLVVLNEQWSNVREIGEVPGSYYMTRAVDQAFWSVLEGGARVKDAVVKWSEVADNEIDRKIKEYS